MEYAYATLLLNETGAEINESNLTGVLDAAGCVVEESRVKALVAALEAVDVNDVSAVEGDTDASDSLSEWRSSTEDSNGSSENHEQEEVETTEPSPDPDKDPER